MGFKMEQLEYKFNDGRTINLDVVTGNFYREVPKIKSEGFRLPTFSEVMKQSILGYKTGDPYRNPSGWSKQMSGDAIIYHPNGSMKIIPGADFFNSTELEIDEKTNSLLISEGLFNCIDGYLFSESELSKYAHSQDARQSLENPIWLALARGDKDLLKDFIITVHTLVEFQDSMKIDIMYTPKSVCAQPLGMSYLPRDGSYNSFRAKTFDSKEDYGYAKFAKIPLDLSK